MALWLKEVGIQLIYVNPDLNNAAAIHASKWIPVRPNQDPALQLAIAYTWITEGTYDKEYVATHSVGFDKWKAYVMGEEDGTPKTPAWASPLCGSAGVDHQGAGRVVRDQGDVRHARSHGGGMQRVLPRAHEVGGYLLGMQGWGQPGRHQYGSVSTPGTTKSPSLTSVTTTAYEERGSTPSSCGPTRPRCRRTKTDRMIIRSRLTEAILNPPIALHRLPFACRERISSSRRPIRRKASRPSTCSGEMPPAFPRRAPTADAPELIWKSPSLEFVMFQHPSMRDACSSADIILPTNTKYEEYDIGSSSDFFACLAVKKPAEIKPVGESKSDYETVRPRSPRSSARRRNQPIGKTVDSMVQEGFDKSGWKDFISWDDLNKKGYCVQGPKLGGRQHRHRSSSTRIPRRTLSRRRAVS